MKLFQPDIFSKPDPEFVPVTVNIFDTVATLLSTQYFFKLDSIKAIRQIKGNEINSNNYKVETTSGDLLVKRNIIHKNISELTKIFELTNWLYRKGNLFFKSIPCRNGNLIAEQDGGLWCVSDFIQGRYFSGDSNDELECVGLRIGHLHNVLQSVPDELQPREMEEVFPVDAKKIIAELYARRDEWADIFSKEHAVIIEDNWDSILSTYELINDKRKVISKSGMQICHIDLHPYNILINQNKNITFIDPDSLVLANPCVSIAFSIYKLIKQSSIAMALHNNPKKISEHAKNLFSSIQESFSFINKETGNLYSFAVAEIFNRILTIFRLSLYDKNKRWNYVLPIHFAGIKEAEIIFSSIMRLGTTI